MKALFTLIVPKNAAGVESYNSGIDDSENQEFYSLDKSEYDVLRAHHVFDILNDRFDLWIDEGESETISAEQLKDAYSSIALKKGTWLDAVNQAIKYGTCIFLVF